LARKNFTKNPAIFISHAGCFLPLLLTSNLLFGWIFFSPKHWLAIEAVLILLFIICVSITIKEAKNFYKKDDDVIDIQAEVISEKVKLGKE